MLLATKKFISHIYIKHIYITKLYKLPIYIYFQEDFDNIGHQIRAVPVAHLQSWRNIKDYYEYNG